MTGIWPWLLATLVGINTILTLILILARRSRPEQISEAAIRDEARLGREEAARAARDLRDEVALRLGSGIETLNRGLSEIGSTQVTQLQAVVDELRGFAASNQSQSEVLRATVEAQLRAIQASTEKRLEQVQQIVDEKLQSTLDRRLGESFNQVSQRLEAVQRGLGEMQALASGVGDLKRVLTNVKARGTWGEIQLGTLLEQILTPEQYSQNVQTKHDSRELVEYAVRLPGTDGDGSSCVWLPIDAKFPQEDYLRLLDAVEAADADAVQKATSGLARAVRASAQDIRDKYLDPPNTTDFAIMFLPTEGLYAEIIRQPGLVEDLQQTCRVVVAGPTTLSALLNSLRMGFRTLAIEKRSSEVWQLLGAVRTEFTKFGRVIEKVKKQLLAASKSIEDTSVRTRAMERTLRSVEKLPSTEATRLLEALPEPETTSEEADSETE